MITLIRGDCVEKMKMLDDESIDLTITSPPYDNLRIYNGVGLLWSETVWQNVIRELFRITKKGGVVVWVVGDSVINGSESGTSFRQALFFKDCGFNLHDTMIYKKKSIPLTHNRYEQNFEYMFVCSKGKPKTFNPIMKKNVFRKTCTISHRQADGSKKIVTCDRKEKGIIGNVFEYNVGIHSSKDKIAFEHPAIFPERLAYDHIISWSNKNDIVLDPFLGSGTTGKMAKLTDRNFIGIELDSEYFQIAQKRIMQAKKVKKRKPFGNFT